MSPKNQGKKEFVYHARSADAVKKRAEQRGGQYDSCYKDFVNVFTPGGGDHRIRILPPTWDTPEHYGMDVWYHSSVGADQQTYLCPTKMKVGECPICEEAKKTGKSTDKDEVLLRALKSYRRVVCWVIDRNDEAVGPLLYPMPWTMDRDVSSMSIDKESGEILQVDNHEDGYDIEFTKEGSGLKTQYTGIMIARRSTVLSSDQRTTDEWIQFVEDNPVPSTLRFYSYDYIKETFEGTPIPTIEEGDVPTRAVKTGKGKTTEIQDRRGSKHEDDRKAFFKRMSQPPASKEEESEDEEGQDDDSDDSDVEEIQEVVEPTTTTSSVRDRIRQGLSKTSR